MTKETKPTKRIGGSSEDLSDRIGRQIQALRLDGKVPMSVAELMRLRLDVTNPNVDIRGSYIENGHFVTRDAIVYHPDGRAKIVLDSKDLTEVISANLSREGVLCLKGSAYDDIQGEEFVKSESEGRYFLSRVQAKANPLWRTLARDQGLLDEYVDYVFSKGGKRFNYNTGMNLHLDASDPITTQVAPFRLFGAWMRSDGQIVHGLDDVGNILSRKI